MGLLKEIILHTKVGKIVLAGMVVGGGVVFLNTRPPASPNAGTLPLSTPGNELGTPAQIVTGGCGCDNLDINGYPFHAMTQSTIGGDEKTLLIPCEEVSPREYRPVPPGSRTPPAPCP